MANQEVWADLDGMKVGILKDWRLNPLTTVQRNSLSGSLDFNHLGFVVFDTTIGGLFMWNGNAWITSSSPSIDIEWNDPLIGTIDNMNATFTTTFNFIPGQINVFINGLLQKIITHYQTIGNNIITFTDSPRVGEILTANYIKL